MNGLVVIFCSLVGEFVISTSGIVVIIDGIIVSGMCKVGTNMVVSGEVDIDIVFSSFSFCDLQILSDSIKILIYIPDIQLELNIPE